jgi:hypothetical protein
MKELKIERPETGPPPRRRAFSAQSSGKACPAADLLRTEEPDWSARNQIATAATNPR